MGSALAPDLEFSFLKYNFELQFIYCIGMKPATHTLVISNKNNREIRYTFFYLKTLFSVLPLKLRFNYNYDILCVQSGLLVLQHTLPGGQLHPSGHSPWRFCGRALFILPTQSSSLPRESVF